MKYKFWNILHNLIAHPLLITGAKFADTFHNWTAQKMTNYEEKRLEFKLPVSGRLPVGYCYENEHGIEVTVIAIANGWCMVTELFKKKPYVVEEEFILAIKTESDLVESNFHESLLVEQAIIDKYKDLEIVVISNDR